MRFLRLRKGMDLPKVTWITRGGAGDKSRLLLAFAQGLFYVRPINHFVCLFGAKNTLGSVMKSKDPFSEYSLEFINKVGMVPKETDHTDNYQNM